MIKTDEVSEQLWSPSLQFSAGYFYNISAELRCTLAARESNSLVPRAAEQLLEEGAFERWEEDLPDVIVEEIPEELTT
jgi:hypothetical protein